MHNDESSEQPHSTPAPQSELSEAEYLARQAAEAKSDLLNALAGIKSGVANSADLRAWVKRYPWAAIGTAAVAGFAAGTTVTPAPGESLEKKLATLHTNGQPAESETLMAAHAAAPTRGSVISEKLISSLFDLAKIAIQSMILATFRPPAASQSQDTADPDPWQTRVAK